VERFRDSADVEYTGSPAYDLKGLTMTPQFLRAEAARFREMAEVADREASRQRLLRMAADYESRAQAADALQPPRPVEEPEAEVEAEAETETEAPAGEPKPKPTRRLGGTRLSLRRPS
jgi:hypothetical protein